VQSGIDPIGGFRTPLCEHRAGFSGMRRDDAAAPNIERIIVVGGATGEIIIGHSYRVGPTATGNLFGASGTRLVSTLARGLCENNGKNSRITRRFGGDQSTYCLLERQ
jgi:hypothetical protein